MKNGDPHILFGATGNFNRQILPYGILFLTFTNTNVFYLLSFKFSRYLLRPWRFPLMEIFVIKKKGKKKKSIRQTRPSIKKYLFDVSWPTHQNQLYQETLNSKMFPTNIYSRIMLRSSPSLTSTPTLKNQSSS